jgi:hypothetical protein
LITSDILHLPLACFEMFLAHMDLVHTFCSRNGIGLDRRRKDIWAWAFKRS